MKKMRIFTVIIFAMLTGCSPINDQSTNKVDLTDIAIDVLYEKIEENGERINCSQPAILSSLSITADQCIEESSPLKGYCITYAKNKIPEITNKINYEKYFDEFAGCMTMRLVYLHPEKLGSFGYCLKQSGPPDTDLVLKSLLSP